MKWGTIFNDSDVIIRNKPLGKIFDHILNNPKQNHYLNHGYTPSGIFSTARKSELLKTYSGILAIESKCLSETELIHAFVKIVTYSPSAVFTYHNLINNSLIILSAVNSTKEHHQIAHHQLANYYQDLANIEINRIDNGITFLCPMIRGVKAIRKKKYSIFKVDLLDI